MVSMVVVEKERNRLLLLWLDSGMAGQRAVPLSLALPQGPATMDIITLSFSPYNIGQVCYLALIQLRTCVFFHFLLALFLFHFSLTGRPWHSKYSPCFKFPLCHTCENAPINWNLLGISTKSSRSYSKIGVVIACKIWMKEWTTPKLLKLLYAITLCT